jgi:hypothetical protein
MLQQIHRTALNAHPRAVNHPRRQRPGPQQGEVRARHFGAGFSGSPHLRHWHRPPPGQHPGHFILTIINLHNVCVYAAHFVRQKYLIICKLEIRNLPWRMGRVYGIHSRICFFLLDDDGIFSKFREQHWNTLRARFAIFATSDLALNQEKCVFVVISELDFPGSPHLHSRRRPHPRRQLG